MSEPIPPGGTPDARLSRPVPDIAIDPVDLPAPDAEPDLGPDRDAHAGTRGDAVPYEARPDAAPSVQDVAPTVTPSSLPPAGPTPRVSTSIEPASPDVVLPGEWVSLPGAHRGGFRTPPTAPVDIALPQPVDVPEFVPDAGTASLPVTTSAGWNPGPYALLFAITALAMSLIVGWLFPLGIVAIVFAVIALRRRGQRRMGAWALGLAILSLAYSAIWLVYAADQGGLL